MEHGFYHPDIGYWQAISDPCDDTRAAYPEGTIEVPLKPGPDHEWQDGEWVHVPPDPADVLQAKREAATLSSVEFFKRAHQFGILSLEESVMGARGDIAPRLLDMIDDLPSDQQAELLITFAGANHFERLDPFLQIFQRKLGISDADADALFGIE